MNSHYNAIPQSIPADRIFIDPNRHIFPSIEDHNVFFFGQQVRTIVTRDPVVLQWWLYDACRWHPAWIDSIIVGLGIRWIPGSMDTDPKPAIIQLCIGARCIIFQLHQAPVIPPSLYSFLLDRKFTFVGLNTGLVCGKLWRHWGLVVARVLDLRQWTATRTGVWPSSIGTLAAMFLGYPPVVEPPWVSTSAWDQRVLSLEQVKYACTDVFIACLLGVTILGAGL